MTPQYKNLISILVKQYSRDSGTESLIGFVASTNGMISACKKLVDNNNSSFEPALFAWLQDECRSNDVIFQNFYSSITQVLDIFDSSQDEEKCYSVLGLTSEASMDEVKAAYRKLSLQYHPDRAAYNKKYDSQSIIEINKAYHSIRENDSKLPQSQKQNRQTDWDLTKKRSVSSSQRRKMVLWAIGLCCVLALVSTIGTINVRKRAMLAGLNEKRGAFIPPTQASESKQLKSKRLSIESRPHKDLSQAEAKVDNSHKEQQNIDTLDTALNNREDTSHKAVEGSSDDILSGGFSSIHSPQEGTSASTAPEQSLNVPENTKRAETIEKIVVGKRKSFFPVISEIPTVVPEETVELDGQKYSVTGKYKKKGDKPSEENVAYVKTVDVSSADGKSGEGGELNKPVNANDSEDVSVVQESKIPPSDNSKIMSYRVEKFVRGYEDAYNKKDIIAFTRFFQSNAVENSEPFTDMLDVYIDLFNEASDALLRVNIITWQEINGEVNLNGRFSVSLKYLDGRHIQGAGPIYFVLQDVEGELRIFKLSYKFDNMR